MTATGGALESALIERILGEYREMPGLALTPDQAQRLWGCDAVTCQAVVELLITRGELRWSSGRRLVRATPNARETAP
jgi:hypothetical protein